MDETQSIAPKQSELPIEMILSSIQAKHKAEKDALLVEIQVFKAVVQGMAAKIRYLQVRSARLDHAGLQVGSRADANSSFQAASPQ